ncbi:MAG TPA: transporter [Lachnospiraceae bacterium]|jgi:energy-coupling factor transport system permease protein|nr:transporter [Lachnospiraceae bacterium]HIS60829.1 energy-coupling factor transporter transmembrane protein EcfT [Candidatus Scybalomonas excrementigallinarum]
MIRDITIGQYYPSHSVLHRLDPRTKIMGTVFFIISLFIGNSILTYGVATLFLAIMIKISKVPLKFILKGLKPIIILLLFSVIINMLFTPGEAIVSIGFLHITKEGIRLAVFLAIRLVYLVIGSSLMTFTTTPTALTDGLERLFQFLKVVKVPVHEVAMMMAIALRFIPILTEELDKIMKAQAARGADFNRGTLKEKVHGLIPIMVPLFIAAIRRSNDLAMAMEARCYHGGEGRTRMKPLVYEKRDYISYLIVLAYFIGIIVLRILL